MMVFARLASWSLPFPPPILFPHILLKSEPNSNVNSLSSIMTAHQQRVPFPSGDQVQVGTRRDQDISMLQENLTPQPPSEDDSSSSFSPFRPARRRSVPHRGFSPTTAVFTSSHRRHTSAPITTMNLLDPRFIAVYKWLDDIEKAGGVQPLDNLPFQPPFDVKHPKLKPSSPVPQPKVDIVHWEDAIEEEEAETPTDIVDSQMINLGITMSGDTAMSMEWPEMMVDCPSSSKVTPTNKTINLAPA